MTMQAITFTQHETAELLPVEAPGPLGAKQVRGATIVTLVSPGTELSFSYCGEKFPNHPGYAAVFRAEEIGTEVQGIAVGDLLFCMGGHRSVQQHEASYVVPVPEGLRSEEAVIARLMGVSMTTLMTTAARPGDLVVAAGMGPVGYLAAHLFASSGYNVCAVEPNEARREYAARSGIKKVYSAMPVDDPDVKGKAALVLECSGHEQAAVEGCRIVRRRGEVVLVGVPWKKCSDLSAHELVYAVFRNYAVLRGGWEWEVPHHASDFSPHSIFSGFRLALDWLASGKMPLEGLASFHDPKDCQAVYQGLLQGKAEGLFQIYRWDEKR